MTASCWGGGAGINELEGYIGYHSAHNKTWFLPLDQTRSFSSVSNNVAQVNHFFLSSATQFPLFILMYVLFVFDVLHLTDYLQNILTLDSVSVLLSNVTMHSSLHVELLIIWGTLFVQNISYSCLRNLKLLKQ